MKLQLVLSGLEANLTIGGGRSYFPLVRHVPPDFPKTSTIWSALQHCQPVSTRQDPDFDHSYCSCEIHHLALVFCRRAPQNLKPTYPPPPPQNYHGTCRNPYKAPEPLHWRVDYFLQDNDFWREAGCFFFSKRGRPAPTLHPKPNMGYSLNSLYGVI